MKTKTKTQNQISELKSRPEQLSTPEQGKTEERPLWCIGYADREFAKLQNDPVLGLVRAATKEEAETKARELGIDDKAAGLWAWPQPKPTAEEIAALTAPSPAPKRDPLPPLDYVKRRKNRRLPTEAVVSLLRTNAPDFFPLAEVVGKWVWIQFADKQPPTVTRLLAELGFHWNGKRQTWQHPCGQLSAGSPRDPRERYGSFFPAETRTA